MHRAGGGRDRGVAADDRFAQLDVAELTIELATIRGLAVAQRHGAARQRQWQLTRNSLIAASTDSREIACTADVLASLRRR
jgi:hypothetical protein